MFNRILNRFEEVLIASFMAAATLVTFAAVVMRYVGRLRHQLGAGADHLSVHLDGEVRRGLWRAHRHPHRRGLRGERGADLPSGAR